MSYTVTITCPDKTRAMTILADAVERGLEVSIKPGFYDRADTLDVAPGLGRHKGERRYDSVTDQWWVWTATGWVSDDPAEMGG